MLMVRCLNIQMLPNVHFLFVDKLHAYILPEDRFVVGDSADFRAFIEAKTGKTVEYI